MSDPPEQIASFVQSLLAEIDIPRLFTALPEEEIQRIIEDREEKIELREREVASARDDIFNWTEEVAALRGALEIKHRLQAEARSEAPGVTPVALISAAELMKRKREAVLRAMALAPARLMTPNETETLIVERGLLTREEIERGTPIRVVMAKLQNEGKLERPVARRYKLASDSDDASSTTSLVLATDGNEQ